MSLGAATVARHARGILRRFVTWRWDAGFYITREGLSTEIVLPNPSVEVERGRIGPKLVVLEFYAPEGRLVTRRTRVVPVGQSRIVRVGDIDGLPAFGQVRVIWFYRARDARGGNRTVFHWPYPGGLTLVHEKKEPRPPRMGRPTGSLRLGQGYMTLFGVPPERPLDLYLVCTSQDRIPARVALVAFGDADQPIATSRPFVVAPWGAAFVDVRALLGEHEKALAGPLAVDARAFAVSYYYFLRNRIDGSWQAQHL
jgi:hypothetical protein